MEPKMAYSEVSCTLMSPLAAKSHEIDEDRLTAVIASLAPEVVSIRYRFDSDWSGDDAVYFRVVLTEEAGSEPRLFEVAKRVEAEVRAALDLERSALLSYFRFRKESSVAELGDDTW